MAVNLGDKKSEELTESLGGHDQIHEKFLPAINTFQLNTSPLNHKNDIGYVDICLDPLDKNEQLDASQTSRSKPAENSSKKRHRKKSQTEFCSDNSHGKSASPGRSAKHNARRSIQESKLLPGRQGESIRSDSAGLGLLSSPTPSHGSGNEAGDVGFKASLLEEVLTEKKMSLLRSPEVRIFLQQQQAQTALTKISSVKKL